VAGLIGIRMSHAEKEHITHAAAVSGMSVSTFATDASLREAERVLSAEPPTTLPPRRN
jgi:uncharacterized protein (DUF1778 family)